MAEKKSKFSSSNAAEENKDADKDKELAPKERLPPLLSMLVTLASYYVLWERSARFFIEPLSFYLYRRIHRNGDLYFSDHAF